MAARLISQSAVIVGGQYYTTREIRTFDVIEQIFDEGAGAVQLIPSGDLPRLRETAGKFIMAVVLDREALAFSGQQLGTESIDNGVKVAQEKLKAVPAWKSLEVNDAELKVAVARKLRASHFIRFKAESSIVPISDAEVKEYYDKNQSKFGRQGYEKYKDNIKAYLSKQQVDRRLKDWFDILKKKYRAQVIL